MLECLPLLKNMASIRPTVGSASWNAWPGASTFPMTPTQPPIYRASSPEGSHEESSRSSSRYQSPSPYGIQTPPLRVMQTPSHSLFYQ
ncbi:hypothetical protein Gogos_003284, partial [Gossypium gossypioides]|nr:hypothetical protein [Gossypium gossypioides]